MLTFAPLLLTAVSVVNLNGASHQSRQEHNEFDTSLRSAALPKSSVGSRRLSIFKSITKSGDQRNAEEDSPAPDDDKTVNEILRHSLVELTDTLGTLESNDPFKAMRISLHVIPVQSPESLMVFESLLKMLSNPKESRSSTTWQQFLIKSIGNQQCSVLDLCKEFHQNFECDGEGHLKVIGLVRRSPFDHLNLLMVPNTVEILNIRRIKLKTISEWSDLRGKSLRVLNLEENIDLQLNLDGLTGDLDHLPLERLSVSQRSLTHYFGERNWYRTLAKIGDWMKTSTLTCLTLTDRSCKSRAFFGGDGTWTPRGHK